MNVQPDLAAGGLAQDRLFLVGLARAAGGAILFSVPILMTMEMWELGFHMPPGRLALLLVATVPMLVGLSHFSGFEETFGWRDDAVDAFVALAVGFVASTAMLALFAVIGPGMSAREITGKVALQAVPASIGALLAQSQLGRAHGDAERRKERQAGYGGEVFMMAAGALFLAFSVAPTEEMALIAYQMTSWHAIALAVTSMLLMHAFVYSVDFRGQASAPEGTPTWSVFLRFTVVGYALALLMSLYMLWTFGQIADTSLVVIVKTTVVLGFPCAVGAAAARLIL